MKLTPTLKDTERDRQLQVALDGVLSLAANGQPEAERWLRAFYLWAHALDDFLDEPSRLRIEALGLSVNAILLTQYPFFQAHQGRLTVLLGVVAAQYEASLNLDLPLPLREGLRLAGNQVILAVALITGGQALLDEVSAELWPIVVKSQIEPDN